MADSIDLVLLTESHVADVARVADDDAISRTSGVPPRCSEADVQQWVRQNQSEERTQLTFAILVDGTITGCCALRHLSSEDRTAELSYWIGVEHWGQGIASSAAAMLRDLAFETFDLAALGAHFLKSSNGASGRILTKLGFVADTDRADLPVDGRYVELGEDVWTFVILTRDRWLSLRRSA